MASTAETASNGRYETVMTVLRIVGRPTIAL
jgi:hypothetical protein